MRRLLILVGTLLLAACTCPTAPPTHCLHYDGSGQPVYGYMAPCRPGDYPAP